MGGSEHDGGSVVPPMQAPQGSHVTGRLPYDWGFRPQRAPRGPEEGATARAKRGPRGKPERAPRGPFKGRQRALKGRVEGGAG